MNKLLVAVDMQNDFIDGVFTNVFAQRIVNDVAMTIENWDGDVVLTQDCHDADIYGSHPESKLYSIHCAIGTRGWELNEKIDKALDKHHDNFKYHRSLLFRKQYFHSEELSKEVYEGEYEEVYLCGLCTDICVISNAIRIKQDNPNVRVVVLSDLCAGTSVDNHNAALAVMKSCGIEVTNSSGYEF